jgi:hypothetical protein
VGVTINQIAFPVVYKGSNDCFGNIRKENSLLNEYFDLARKMKEKVILKTYFGRKFFSYSFVCQVFKIKHLRHSYHLNGLIMYASKTTQ